MTAETSSFFYQSFLDYEMTIFLMQPRCPVVLVHGWKSHPGVWKPLIRRLEEESFACWNFSHSGLRDAGAEEIGCALMDFIHTMQEEHAYRGPVDLVCHSMGAAVARYTLEVMDRASCRIPARMLIGIGPPNNGSSMAELFNDPVHGPEILRQLTGTFVPKTYDPAEDRLVQEFRRTGPFVEVLRKAGLRRDVSYRVIVAGNPTATPEFFPLFGGQTWEYSPSGWQKTVRGDGIVSHADSLIPGAKMAVLPADPTMLNDAPAEYCHLRLPGNPEVVEQVIRFLRE
jgi:pimeloyl-ACP methyl ester carboxylesterase